MTVSPGTVAVRRATAWRKFRSRRSAVAALAFLLGLLAAAALAWPWSAAWFDAQDLTTGVRHPPSVHLAVDAGLYDPAAARYAPHWSRPFGEWLGQAGSWLGHDELGRSLLLRMALGLLVSAGIALGAAGTALVVGTLWGAAAGVFGGRTDQILMRIVDGLYGLPYILMVILMKVALDRPLTALLGGRTRYADLVILFLAIGSVSWLTVARVVRGLVMSLAQEGYVEAARAMGAGAGWIFRRHLLPNLAGPVTAYASLVLPQAMLQEAFLSFLGIGVQPPLPSLGRLAADGVAAVSPFIGFWWLLIFPCGLLAVILLALNVVGEALREALDPRSQRRLLIQPVAPARPPAGLAPGAA